MELNKIYNIDCLEGLKLLKDKSIDLIITDPPYNFESFGGGFYSKNNKNSRDYLNKTREIKCDEFNPIPFLNEFKRIMVKFNGVFFCNKFLVDIYIKWARDNEYLFDIHILSKSNPIPAKNNHFLHDTEYIIYIKERGAYFNSSLEFKEYYKIFRTSVKQDNIHPNQKPVKLIQKYIKVLSKEKDLVLDCFMGSGTTAVACKELDRNFIGFEIDKDYYNIATERIKKVSNLKLNSFFN